MSASAFKQRAERLPEQLAVAEKSRPVEVVGKPLFVLPKGHGADLHAPALPPRISTRNLNFFYGANQALIDNNIDIAAQKVTAIIGPSGCGKSTHIRVYNRIYELYRDQRAEGEVLLDGENILSPSFDLIRLRRLVGMIFQKPTPFPMTVFDNVAYGLRLHYQLSKGELAQSVEQALRDAVIWDEVKDKLRRRCPAASSSGCALRGPSR